MGDLNMAKAAAISFKEFRTRYNTEAACREELFRQRFPKGFVCPKCGCTEYYPIRGRKTCQCRSCRHQTSVTSGTVMHRTHLPLTILSRRYVILLSDLLALIVPLDLRLEFVSDVLRIENLVLSALLVLSRFLP